MAIGQGDGSIILSTKVDTSGINKGMNSIKGTIGKIGASIGVAFGVSALVNFGKAAVNLASDLQEVQNVVDVAFGDMSYKAEEFAKSAIENFGISELSAKRTASTYMAMAKGMGIAEDVASDMAITMTGLTADIASFYNMSQERADVILKSVYTGETETLKQLGIVMTEVNLENFAMSKGITKNLSAMTQQEKTMLRYQFVLEQTQLAQGDFVRTQDSWANQTRILTERWKEMQRIFGEAFMMIGTLILPAINDLVYGLTKVAEFAKVAESNIYELFTGKKFSEQEESTKQTAENIQEQAENQEELNKQMKKTLAGFDDIQILSSQTSEATVTSGDNSVTSTIGVEETTTGTTTEADTSKYQEIASAIKLTLADILDAASNALLAVGLIVLFYGNILGGIGLIMAGSAAYVAGDALGSENPLETLKGHLDAVKEYIVPALFGIGVLLLFLGMIPLGIGLILGGISYWGYKEVHSEEYKESDFQTKLNVIMEAVSLGLVAIGVMLIFFGQIPLGIGLIIAGKSLLNATEEKLNEGGVTTKIQKFIDDNAGLIVGVGIALVVIALIMFAFGVFSPLSIGLLVAGGAVLATDEEMNPGVIKESITNFFKDNAGLIVGVSTALIVLGVILLFTGVGIPLAIGLIVAGGGSLAATVALNWNFIVDKVKEVWQNVKNFWNAHIAPIFTAEWWRNLGKKAMNGLISGFEGGINGIIKAFESMINWIVDGLNKISFDIPDWLGGGSFGINLPRANFGRVKIPRLAKGAVIPPNREFLAVLGDQKQGTNIETPLDTMLQAFKQALSEGGYGQNQTVVLELDGRELGRTIVRLGKQENNRVGSKLRTT